MKFALFTLESPVPNTGTGKVISIPSVKEIDNRSCVGFGVFKFVYFQVQGMLPTAFSSGNKDQWESSSASTLEDKELISQADKD